MNLKIAKLVGCSFIQLSFQLNFDAREGHAALGIEENSKALICFGGENHNSCDIFYGNRVSSSQSTEFGHSHGSLGFYKGKPITVGGDSDGFKKVESFESSSWKMMENHPT